MQDDTANATGVPTWTPPSLPTEDRLPLEFQYLPPGRHRIEATQGGEAVRLEVQVDAKAADILQSFLDDALAEADSGRGDVPFFDFNHEDGAAAAWPRAFRWAGDDPKTGGVRVAVEWSSEGAAAVQGRCFRRFSPSFHVDRDGQVSGSEVNMGGLVNRAAFRGIAAIAARSANREKVERLRSLVSGQHHDNLDTLIETACREIEALEKLRGEVSRETADRRVIEARAFVEAGIEAGRIPVGNATLQAFWAEAHARDAVQAKAALGAQPVRTDLLQPVQAKGNVSRTERQEAALAQLADASPDQSFARRFDEACRRFPDLFDAEATTSAKANAS